MLTAKKSLMAVVILMIISVSLTVMDGAREPKGSGQEHDSFGLLGHGLRGLYETLTALDMKVVRSFSPPSAVVNDHSDACMVIWSPSPHKIKNELRHIEQLGRWVRAGGRLIVAPAINTETGTVGNEMEPFFLQLGLKDVSFYQTVPGSSMPSSVDGLPSFKKEVWNGLLAAPTAIDINPKGRMVSLLEGTQAIALPIKSINTLGVEGHLLSPDRVDFKDASGQENTLVAILPLGEGEVVVVADPRLAVNKYLGFADNGVFMALLLGEHSRTVVFDEFLHGVGSRGNILHLFSRRPYGYMALSLLLIALLWCWRSAIVLGPPLPEGRTPRRDISDYVNAMANLFLKNRAYRFALAEVREGVLRRLAQKYYLSPHKADVPSIAKAMSKKDPEASGRFEEAMTAVDKILKNKREPSAKRLALTTRELAKCR